MSFELYTSEEKGKLPDFAALKKTKESYIASIELRTAVNVALALGQPLLLTGEPGAGKTRLAYHLADFFGLGEPLVFNAQTNSVKKDLFYSYDALGHFQRAHNQKEGKIAADEIENSFIRYEALGEAIRRAADEKGVRSVVLIDEIDKAPRDLPNDLLAAIEELVFEVPEIPGKTKRWECPQHLIPLIIITSNSEKDLPNAFLRRVVYHHIEFPTDEKLLEILAGKQIKPLKKTDLRLIVTHFNDIRNHGLNKRPATAELISWAILLSKINFPFAKLAENAKLNDPERQLLNSSYAVLAKTQEDLQKIRK